MDFTIRIPQEASAVVLHLVREPAAGHDAGELEYASWGDRGAAEYDSWSAVYWECGVSGAPRESE